MGAIGRRDGRAGRRAAAPPDRAARTIPARSPRRRLPARWCSGGAAPSPARGDRTEASPARPPRNRTRRRNSRARRTRPRARPVAMRAGQPRPATRPRRRAPRARPTLVDRLQSRHDLLASRFEEWWQHDMLSKRCFVLVNGETRAIGRDLEEDAVRLAEVEAAEVVAVHLAAVRNAERVEPVCPRV